MLTEEDGTQKEGAIGISTAAPPPASAEDGVVVAGRHPSGLASWPQPRAS